MLQGNMGAGVSAMGSTMANAQDKAMQRKLMDMQFQEAEQGLAQKKVALEKSVELQAMMKGMFPRGADSSAVSPGAFAPSADGMGPTMPPSMASMGRTGSAIGGLNIDQVAMLKAAGGPDLLDAFKWANDPLKMEGGSTYKDRITGKQTFMPKVDAGVTADANGFYAPLPGYAAAMGVIEGESALARERAKAQYDPYIVTPKGSDSPQLDNRANVMQPGGAPVAPVAPVAAASSGAAGSKVSGYAGGSRATADAGALGILQRELVDPKYGPEDRAAISREIAKIQKTPQPVSALQPASAAKPAASQQGGPMLLQSPSEAAALLDQAKIDIEKTSVKANNINSAMNAYKLINTALAHPGLDASTGLNSLSPMNLLPGSAAKDYAAFSKQLKGGAFLAAFERLKGAGALSEAEGNKGTDAIARLDTSQSPKAYRQALADYQVVLAQGLKVMGIDAATGNRIDLTGMANPVNEPPAAAPRATQSFNAPPPASKYKGKFMTNPDGSTSKSDGLIWKKVQQ
jgi:hypothetical protein